MGVVRRWSLLLGALLLSGCQLMPTVAQMDPPPEPIQPAPVQVAAVRSALAVRPPAPSGAIFQSTQYRPLFEDHRARLVGDTLLVQIVERVSASARSSSSVEKKGSLSGGISAAPFLPVSTLGKLSIGGDSSNTFSGKGGTENNNNFSGTITAVVTDVLTSGHLIIAGEKQIGINDNVDVLRFTGQVDPRSIQPGNTVASAQIANVRIEQKSRGGQADAQRIGWLSRYFLNLMPI
jgi:flagellar L-ring protein precursor FlgH